LEQQFDYLIFLPIEIVEQLTDYQGKRTAIEVYLSDEEVTNTVKSELKDIMGGAFTVKDRDEQNEALFKAIKIEKLFIFVSLLLIIGIASFNTFGVGCETQFSATNFLYRRSYDCLHWGEYRVNFGSNYLLVANAIRICDHGNAIRHRGCVSRRDETVRFCVRFARNNYYNSHRGIFSGKKSGGVYAVKPHSERRPPLPFPHRERYFI
jgi:hypothetical protein